MRDLHVTEWGDGARVVLLHGSLSDGEEAWSQQRPLASAGYRLVLPDRRGYGRSVAGDGARGEDYERDAHDIAPLLGDGAHLVGHSYGALSALWTAALRPEAVRSLTVIEPPAFALVADHPAVAEFMVPFQELYARAELTDREFLEAFLRWMDMPSEMITPEVLDEWTPAAATLRGARVVWEASVPVEVLNAVLFPRLVMSGAHNPAFTAVAEALAGAMGASQVVLPGAGHMIQMLGDPFNDAVLQFWRAADRERETQAAV